MIYPSLPARYDFGLFRIGGAGMGNCFYNYFHAVVLSKDSGRKLISPTWPSLRIGPMLRRELSMREYGKMFRAHPEEVSGVAKAAALIRGWLFAERVQIRQNETLELPRDVGLTIVETPEFTFNGLHDHRDLVRSRLLEIMVNPPVGNVTWGAGGYIAAHIRMGDFAVSTEEQVLSGQDNLRIPLSWYVRVVQRLRDVYPELPLYVFSDGTEAQLEAVLSIDGVKIKRGVSDIDELLSMAQASILLGSNSTFSRWAAFLGNMPTIWLRTKRPTEKPSGASVPITFVGDDLTVINRGLGGDL